MGGVELQLHTLLTSGLDGDESALAPAASLPGKEHTIPIG